VIEESSSEVPAFFDLIDLEDSEAKVSFLQGLPSLLSPEIDHLIISTHFRSKRIGIDQFNTSPTV
jgi:hypothetical protein